MSTGNFGITIGLNRRNFMEVSNTLICEERLVCVVVNAASTTLLDLWDCWSFVKALSGTVFGAAARGET